MLTWALAQVPHDRFAGRVDDSCLDSGNWYERACGPRTSASTFINIGQWTNTYTEHRGFDAGRAQRSAGLFHQLSIASGGSSNGYAAQRIADAWFQRDVATGDPPGADQAAPFYRAVCKQMRLEYDTDPGPEHTNHSEGSMAYLVADFLYSSCKREKFELCSNPFAIDVIDTAYEIKNCLFDHPKCRREREHCLGAPAPAMAPRSARVGGRPQPRAPCPLPLSTQETAGATTRS